MPDSAVCDMSCFDVHSIAQAMSVICTAEDSTTEQRWQHETPYLADLMAHNLEIKPHHRVLDYGCGIGRIAKALIHRSACSVVGVDTSMSMRALAPTYVLDKRFLACSPEMLPLITRTHFAIAVWTLQHIPNLQGAIDLIHQQLLSYGRLFVVNVNGRCIPIGDGKWRDDGVDARELLAARFNELAFGMLDPDKTTPRTARVAFWGVYERKS